MTSVSSNGRPAFVPNAGSFSPRLPPGVIATDPPAPEGIPPEMRRASCQNLAAEGINIVKSVQKRLDDWLWHDLTDTMLSDPTTRAGLESDLETAEVKLDTVLKQCGGHLDPKIMAKAREAWNTLKGMKDRLENAGPDTDWAALARELSDGIGALLGGFGGFLLWLITAPVRGLV